MVSEAGLSEDNWIMQSYTYQIQNNDKYITEGFWKVGPGWKEQDTVLLQGQSLQSLLPGCHTESCCPLPILPHSQQNMARKHETTNLSNFWVLGTVLFPSNEQVTKALVILTWEIFVEFFSVVYCFSWFSFMRTCFHVCLVIFHCEALTSLKSYL